MAFDDLQFPMPVPDPNRPGETKDTFDNVVGGSATYASFAAACYAPVRIVAVVGDDFPKATLEQLAKRQIDTTGIEQATGLTFRWKGRYRPDMVGRDTLDTQLNVFADFRPKLPDSYRDTEVVLLGNIHPALQLEVLDQVSSPQLVIADTMNFWISGEAETLAALLKRIDVLVINDEEARLLSGIHNIPHAAKDILARGPKKLIIKRGEYGSLYFDDDGVFAAPALPLETVADPTGAGDSFAGGLVGHLARQGNARHQTMRHAIVHGTATASYCVQAVGTGGLANLELSAIEQRVSDVRKLYYLGESP